MVLKLIKHEFKYLGRYLLLIWVGLVLMIISQRVLIEFRDSDMLLLQIAGATAIPVLIFSLIAMHLITFVVVILRFYQNMFTGEGYLTFTLPVKTGQIVFSKLLVGLMIMLVPLIVTVTVGISFLNVNQFTEIAVSFIREYLKAGYSPLTLILVGITIVISMIIQIMDFYLAMSFGQLANRNKVVFSIIAYIGIYMVKQVVGTLTMVVFFMTGYLETLNEKFVPEAINGLMGISLLIAVLALAVEWLLVNYLCKNKLNLE